MTIDRDLRFGHRFEQGRLRTRRSAIDFVGQQDMTKHRSFVKPEGLARGVENRHAGDIAGQQIRRELHSRKSCLDRARQGLRQSGFSSAGEIVQQHMLPGNPGRHNLADIVVLPVQHSSDVGGDFARRVLGGHSENPVGISFRLPEREPCAGAAFHSRLPQ